MAQSDDLPVAFEPAAEPATARIVVVGVGGGGGNAVAHMAAHAVAGVRYIAANTDDQALRHLPVPNTLQLGAGRTRGLGAGADPAVGRAAAVEDRELIQRALEGADMVFVAAGMGGGTGTGAAPVVAHVAKALDILTVAVVTRPFWFENRNRVAEEGIADLRSQVDSLIAIPNDRLLDTLGEDASLESAFAAANDVLRGAVEGIADIVLRPGLINADFQDVRRVMSYGGVAVLGTGQSRGPDRVRGAIDAAIKNPILEDIVLRDARGVLVNVTMHRESVREFREVGEAIRKLTNPESKVILGLVKAPELGEDLRVTVVATGLGQGARDAAGGLSRRGPARSQASGAGVAAGAGDVPLDVASFLERRA